VVGKVAQGQVFVSESVRFPRQYHSTNLVYPLFEISSSLCNLSSWHLHDVKYLKYQVSSYNVFGHFHYTNQGHKYNLLIFLQDKKCTYNITLRRVFAAIFYSREALSNIEHVRICGLRYPTRNAHAQYYLLWHAPLCNIFPYYLINDTIFEKKKLLRDIKCVFWVPLQTLSEIVSF
jgi:hypothetical protein